MADSGQLAPLRLESTPVLVADRLREGILDGTFPPRTQLSEVALSQQLSVSRGPIREAMQRLLQEGLLRGERNRGVFVVDLGANDVRDIYLARSAVERTAAALVGSGGHGRGLRLPAVDGRQARRGRRQQLGRADPAGPAVPPRARGGGSAARDSIGCSGRWWRSPSSASSGSSRSTPGARRSCASTRRSSTPSVPRPRRGRPTRGRAHGHLRGPARERGASPPPRAASSSRERPARAEAAEGRVVDGVQVELHAESRSVGRADHAVLDDDRRRGAELPRLDREGLLVEAAEAQTEDQVQVDGLGHGRAVAASSTSRPKARASAARSRTWPTPPSMVWVRTADQGLDLEHAANSRGSSMSPPAGTTGVWMRSGQVAVAVEVAVGQGRLEPADVQVVQRAPDEAAPRRS